ncbi:Stk1 family PASTA domain-containing Ser/Thr kinase [Saccharibacillus alkalitolerans]|uniref:non-specific serine/threonine protein kinase n=1 Tax=Saccharibacillus alkalitolerans TaxID=2705290 RepID=A0ABX0F484_9BACL|nr:Stk1 family PASTA domain-containing Ser/Thr kinase [Saccharibacillus alkalitolerans]NGZ74006.1 Stk1 family PASTA domain-containing Ser/Thr kinase [Saccharibacillus alkalitolerans]
MIGQVFSGRYEILERVGGGGMALVYKALDLLLNRFVAVKVLRQQFMHDEEFIRRFRREAQSAASLSHPNIVSIYDVGQDGEVQYIVMEYIEGRDLDEVIKERAPLPVEEAVRIASQICDALDHAHNNQIIHRDIKPHNILIGRNGRVKVTDFGIARAVTSTTITQTGSVVGSVHYFSPEHAKGVTAGEKSDLYSLGIVLYQMLTGALPYEGESPISVALKHLQDEFEEPRKLNPMIPQSVENIIVRAMRKNPSERYSSASEMQSDLDTCLLPSRRDEQKVNFDDNDDADRTLVVPAIRSSYTPPSAEMQRGEAAGKGKAQPGGKKNWKKPAIIIGSTLLVLAIVFIGVMYWSRQFVVPETTVPNVVGMTEDEARNTLAERQLEVEGVKYEYDPSTEAGTVFKQSKPEGLSVKEGASVLLTVGSEKPLSKMPSLTSSNYDEARRDLVALGVTEDRIVRSESFDNSDPETVIAQSPQAGEDFDPDQATVTLTVSKGVENKQVPDVVGKTRQEALDAINGQALAPSSQEEPSFTVDKGKVVSQDPQAGTEIKPGATVKFVVSSGIPPEALNFTVKVPVEPSQEGVASKIRIEYSDARGERIEWGQDTISSLRIFPVSLVLAPNRNGAITVYRDGALIATYPVDYTEAARGTFQQPEMPKKEPEPTPPPAEPAPVDPPADNGAQNEGNAEPDEGANVENAPENGQEGQGEDTGEEEADPSAFVPPGKTTASAAAAEASQEKSNNGRGNGNGKSNGNGNGNGKGRQ